jgi:hypothetical protein
MNVNQYKWLSLLVFNVVICLLREEGRFLFKTLIRTNEQDCFPLDEYANVFTDGLAEAKIKSGLLMLLPEDGLIMNIGFLSTSYTRRVIS